MMSFRTLFSVGDRGAMEEVIAELDLEEDLASALLGHNNEANLLGRLYDLIRAYDEPDWSRAVSIAQEFRLGMVDLSTAYVQAVEWADVAAKA